MMIVQYSHIGDTDDDSLDVDDDGSDDDVTR